MLCFDTDMRQYRNPTPCNQFNNVIVFLWQTPPLYANYYLNKSTIVLKILHYILSVIWKFIEIKRKCFFKNILFHVLCLYLCIELCFGNRVDVKTSSGVVRGQTIQVLNRRIDQFLGIPYAEPPIGELRFAKPQPLKKPKEVNIFHEFNIKYLLNIIFITPY